MSLSPKVLHAGHQGSPAVDRPKIMRKSCHFCRTRKIRCSSESICGACRERNLDCSYELEGPKGRPKGSTCTPYRRVQGPRRQSQEFLLSASGSPSKIARVASMNNLPRTDTTSPATAETSTFSSSAFALSASDRQLTPACNEKTVAASLQRSFDTIFLDRAGYGANAFDEAFMVFNPHLMKAGLPSDEVDSSHGCADALTYEEVFFVLSQDILELVLLRFGDLGCCPLEGSQRRFLVSQLASDETTSMFEPVPETTISLFSEQNNNRVVQMIEVWFSQHPLSFIVSKTLLLRSLRSRTVEDVLLAAMIADVKCSQEDKKARAEGQQLFKWATAQLRERSDEVLSMSLIQAILLLGWRELCMSGARRAIIYFGWLAYAIPKLPAPKPGLNQTNGIDVGEVEQELRGNMHWVTFAVNLWAFMQLDSPLPTSLAAKAPTRFPHQVEYNSAVFRLDSMSDNLATMPNQTRMFRELWPLSHVASTIAHIYALYPRQETADQSFRPTCWQSRTLLQLRHLSNIPQDMSFLCAKTRHVMRESLQWVETCVENPSSQALVFTACHTLLINFLFPSLKDDSGQVAATVTLIDDLCTSAEALLKMFATLDQPLDNNRVIMASRPSGSAHFFALALDACGRAMNYLHSRTQFGSEAEKRTVSGRATELLELTAALRDLSKHTTLMPSSRMTRVKRQLKDALRAFEAPQSPPVPTVHAAAETAMDCTSNGLVIRPANYATSTPILPEPQPTPSQPWNQDDFFQFFLTKSADNFHSYPNAVSGPGLENHDPFLQGNMSFDGMHLDSYYTGAAPFNPPIGSIPNTPANFNFVWSADPEQTSWAP